MTSNGPPLHFLVVDDQEDIRDVFVHILERFGYTADTACDGVEAVELLAVELYDVMLLDLTMPRMSGEDVVRRLREHHDRSQGLRAHLGVRDVLAKPLRMQQRELAEVTSASLRAS